jgi:LmbE family N-acetylglucosaminyl deacetylase
MGRKGLLVYSVHAATLSLLLSACTTLPLTDTYPVATPDHVEPYCAFYIAAHPDDIELFMGRNAWSDIVGHQAKTVFVVLSAADGGRGTEIGGTGKPYFRAREEGHERAIRFWASLDGQPVPDTKMMDVAISGKILHRQSVAGRIVIYNLRLPDGGLSGTGYPSTGYQSLSLLRSGKIAEMHSIASDLSLTYTELKELIRGIVKYEAHQFPTVWVHIQDENLRVNPFDHPDHTATASTVADAIADPSFHCVSVARYTTYVNAEKSPNLSSSDLQIHVGTWGALNSALVDDGQANTWDSHHNVWLGKEYFSTRQQRSHCNF